MEEDRFKDQGIRAEEDEEKKEKTACPDDSGSGMQSTVHQSCTLFEQHQELTYCRVPNIRALSLPSLRRVELALDLYDRQRTVKLVGLVQVGATVPRS